MDNNSSDLIKKTVNNLLDYIKKANEIPMILPAERELSGKFDVSRSTLIKAFYDLEEKKVVRQEKRSRLVLRLPLKEDYYDHIDKVSSKTDNVENYILQKFAKLELKPGDKFSELQIAREINANTVTVREVLLKISRTGLIKKKPRKQWEVISISAETFNEITEYRQLLEIEGLRCLLKGKEIPEISQKHYKNLLEKHLTLQAKNKIDWAKIVSLESELHKGMVSHTENQFILDNYDSLFLIIRYHLGQHNMTQSRFKDVIKEHIDVIEAILEGDFKKSVNALKHHFDRSKHFFSLANESLEANALQMG